MDGHDGRFLGLLLAVTVATAGRITYHTPVGNKGICISCACVCV